MPHGSRVRILVVDDDYSSRTFLKYGLEHFGAAVAVAEDGQEGLELARAERPDIIVSDALMPRMDGFQFLFELRKDENLGRIPFVFYSSAYTAEADMKLAEAAGADAFLLKPMMPDELWSRIMEIAGAKTRKAGAHPAAIDDEQYLRAYSNVVAAKLEEKVAELESEILRSRLAEERLHSLSKSLLALLEQERRHIARELHDEIGQALTVVKMNLQALARNPAENKAGGLLKDSVSTIERAMLSVRTLSVSLRPSVLDDLGLVSALRWYVDRTGTSGSLIAEFRADMGPERLPVEIETACFRIAQEALTNVLKHAAATRISVRLRALQDSVELVIADNGKSFDLEAAQARAVRGDSFGILGMQERAALAGGSLEFEAAPGKGTTVRARFPVPGMQAAA